MITSLMLKLRVWLQILELKRVVISRSSQGTLKGGKPKALNGLITDARALYLEDLFLETYLKSSILERISY